MKTTSDVQRPSAVTPIPTWFLVALYAGIALALALTHRFFIDDRAEEVRRALHEQVMTGNAPAPIQYRVMVYYLAEGLTRIGVAFNTAYLLIRFTFIFLSAWMMNGLLRRWFVPVAAMAGTLMLLACIPLTFLRYYMQPMDLPNLFFYLAGCRLIAARRDWWVLPLMCLAMLNRESAIMLVAVYTLFRYDELPFKTIAVRSGVLAAAGLGTYSLLRAVFHLKKYYADVFYLYSNLTNPTVYVCAAALFGALVLPAFSGYDAKPKFVRRWLMFIPFFLAIHFSLTILAEPRLWLPVLPPLIAAALWYVMGDELKMSLPADPAPQGHLLARYPKTAYTALFCAFLIFFSWFCMRYQAMHMGDRARWLRAESFKNAGRAYLQSGRNNEALAAFKQAAELMPSDATAHHQLAQVYTYVTRDYRAALAEYNKTLEIEPYYLERKNVRAEIERLSEYLKQQPQ